MKSALQWAKERYTCKAYDGGRKIEADKLARILEVLRLAPSSVNSQPWRFLVTGSDEGKARVAKAMQGTNLYNAPKVQKASHVVVLCTLSEITAEHIQAVDLAEAEAGRIAFDSVQQSPRHRFFNGKKSNPEQLFHWAECQTFIALGQLLWAAALEMVDSTVIGGFDKAILDEELGLQVQGLRSTVICCLGYRAQDEENHKLSKARLSKEAVFDFF